MAISRQNRIGSYELLNLLRTGQACEIWKVRRSIDDERLAMKLLRRGAYYTREQLYYLKNEFQVGRDLDHERVIRFYEYETSSAGNYLIMELYQVPTLKQWLLQNPQLVLYLLETILSQSAESLGHMHEHAWIHCDVKPDNFLMNDEGSVKLIDFSLAQRRAGIIGRLVGGRSRVQGTKSYMAPEQIRGKAVDARTDVYGLGCMWFELAANKLPFTGNNPNELLTKHLRTRPPSLETVNRNIDSSFAELVARMMAKDPARRPPSMAALIEDLHGIQVFRRKPEPPPPQAETSNPS